MQLITDIIRRKAKLKPYRKCKGGGLAVSETKFDNNTCNVCVWACNQQINVCRYACVYVVLIDLGKCVVVTIDVNPSCVDVGQGSGKGSKSPENCQMNPHVLAVYGIHGYI